MENCLKNIFIFKLACTAYADALSDRILNGEDAKRGEFPWMAALGYVSQNYKVSFDCGGTVISEFYVLTAAHCVSSGRPPSVVRLGRVSLRDETEDETRTENRVISIIIKHPDFKGTEKKNDIALVRVNKRIWFTEYIKPACLQTHIEDEGPDVVLTAIGWGLVAEEVRDRPDILRKVELRTVPLSQCNRTLLEYNQNANQKTLRNGITEGQYCAHDADPNGQKDTCQGDSGGPLQAASFDSKMPKIVGIVSFGITCGSPYPSVYTRVAHYLDWIEANVWPNGEINPPVFNFK